MLAVAIKIIIGGKILVPERQTRVFGDYLTNYYFHQQILLLRYIRIGKVDFS